MANLDSIVYNHLQSVAPKAAEKFSKAIKERINSLVDVRVERKPAFKGLRRILVFTFPYVIYYRRDESERKIEIMAVLHNKQSSSKFEQGV